MTTKLPIIAVWLLLTLPLAANPAPRPVAISSEPAQDPPEAELYNLANLERAYAANNQKELPVLSLMNWGRPIFVLYPDGRLIAGAGSKRPNATTLSDSEMAAVLSEISGREALWGLFPKYDLWPGKIVTHEPLRVLTLRIPGRTEKRIEVYGPLKVDSRGSVPPPKAFNDLLDLLPTLMPDRMEPWDPGYVHIYWSDYSHAPEPSVPWPSGWPGLSHPLVRRGNDASLIRYHMTFPSSLLDELEKVLAGRPQRGAILIDGWKASAKYRWPLPNEKEWTTWNQ